MMRELLFTLIGVLVSGIGYLIKRTVEKKSNTETLDRKRKVLEIHKQMKEQGLNIKNLLELESQLVNKQKSILKNAIELSKDSKPLIASVNEYSTTQGELNKRAGQNFEDANNKLQIILKQLLSKSNKNDKESLCNSQRLWEEYSIEQALSVSSNHQGGTIYPLFYFTELESLTLERAARLKAELDELK